MQRSSRPDHDPIGVLSTLTRPAIAFNGSLAVMGSISGGDAWFVPVNLTSPAAEEEPILLDDARESWTAEFDRGECEWQPLLVVWSGAVAWRPVPRHSGRCD